jgi:hypothetical protein
MVAEKADNYTAVVNEIILWVIQIAGLCFGHFQHY